ncbi:MAG: hypothetical protein HY084_06990 [Gemmatimonadetes bacterium]|nr:hypothetical protein [Gemmatimonadota bacterium]
MNQHASTKAFLVIAYGLAALPIGFGALRLLTTGRDARYLIIAIASLVTAVTVFRTGASRGSPRWLLALVAVVASTLVGVAIAAWQGAGSRAAVLFVTLSFSLCFTVSGMLGAFSGRRQPESG